MNKLPVMGTTAASYRFVFENYFRLLGVTWAPMAVVFALMAWQLLPFVGVMQRASQTHDVHLILSTLGHLAIFEVASLLLLIVVTVGVTKLALQRSVRWPWFYLAFGRDFWRLLGVCVLVGLILLGALIIGIILSSLAAGAISAGLSSGSGGSAASGPAVLSGSVIAAIVVIYALVVVLWVRLAFLLPPITIAEQRIGIGRNWKLTRGNFWRIVALLLIALVPLLLLVVLQYVALAVFGGPSMNILQTWGTQATRLAMNQRVLDLYATYWYIYIPAWFLLIPITYGPLLASSAVSYQALVPRDPATP